MNLQFGQGIVGEAYLCSTLYQLVWLNWIEGFTSKCLTLMVDRLVLLPRSSTGSTVWGPLLLRSKILELEAVSLPVWYMASFLACLVGQKTYKSC